LFLLLALIGALGVLFAASPAYAEGEAIRGKVVGPVIDGTRSPVEGVAITVSGAGGFTQTVTSDDTGAFEVPLPAPGEYKVALDTTTLPEGLSTPEPERTLTVGAGEQKAALFPLNEGSGPAEVASTRIW
jgi:branched-chain amino acid transport system permease protein